jgi:hypothetical protein
MSEETSYMSGPYRIELLKSSNWLPWKRRMLAVLRDQKLAGYIEKDAAPPVPKDPKSPTEDETKAIKAWTEGDYRTQTRIELSIGDAEIVHILGATTARQMWEQLTLVKENRGKLGAIMARKVFYRYEGEEGLNIVDHVAKLREMQEELHLMGSRIEDEEFVNVLMMSLPESWENFLTSFMGSRTDEMKMPSSHQMIAMLLEEERRRTKRTGGSQDVAMHGKFAKGDKKKNLSNSDKECYNCKKKGHVSKDCWAKGGGKEGQGPSSKKKSKEKQEKTNQATESINDSLNIAYVASKASDDRNIWILDSATTSHISNDKRAFEDLHTLTNSTVKGIGKEPATAAG